MAFPWINDPHQVMARTIWGENRGGGWIGMQSVANAIMNRAAHPRWWGKTPLTICLDREQFSTWNALTDGEPEDANYLATIAAGPATEGFDDALTLAAMALAGRLPDVTEGADSYYAAASDEPAWAKEAVFTVEIAGQRFYRTI